MPPEEETIHWSSKSAIILPVSMLALLGVALSIGQRYGSWDTQLQTMIVKLNNIEQLVQKDRDVLIEQDRRLLRLEQRADFGLHKD